MTREQYYKFVEIGGPRLKQALQAELPQLRSMNREEAQEHINELSRQVKEKVREEMRQSLVN